MRMFWGILIAILTLGGPAIGGYCPYEPQARQDWASEARPVREDPQSSDTAPRTLLIAIVALLAGLLLGRSASARPSLMEVEAAIDAAFAGRVREAGAHSRRKLPPALTAAKAAVIAEVRKLWA